MNSVSSGRHSKKNQDEPFPGTNTILKYYNNRKLTEYPSHVLPTIAMAPARKSLAGTGLLNESCLASMLHKTHVFPSSEFHHKWTELKLQIPYMQQQWKPLQTLCGNTFELLLVQILKLPFHWCTSALSLCYSFIRWYWVCYLCRTTCQALNRVKFPQFPIWLSGGRRMQE